MRSRYLFVAIIFVTLFTVILVLIVAGILPPSTVPQINSPAPVQDKQVEQVEVQVNANALVAATLEPVASQATPIQDGPALSWMSTNLQGRWYKEFSIAKE